MKARHGSLTTAAPLLLLLPIDAAAAAASSASSSVAPPACHGVADTVLGFGHNMRQTTANDTAGCCARCRAASGCELLRPCRTPHPHPEP